MGALRNVSGAYRNRMGVVRNILGELIPMPADAHSQSESKGVVWVIRFCQERRFPPTD